MSNISIPKKWKLCKINEIYDVRDGTHDSPKYHEQGYPLITSKNLKQDGLNFLKIKYISRTDYEQINQRSKVDKGDLLFAMIGTIGNPTVVEREPNFAIKNVALFKANKESSIYFLQYYLQTRYVKNKMEKEAKGTTQKFVGLGYLRNFPIPVPPIEEQKRIVEILDEAFEKISIAEANTKKNLTNSIELFDSYLNKYFSNKNQDWKNVKLKNITSKIGSGSTPKGGKNSYKSEGISLIRSLNVYDRQFKKQNLAFIDENQAEKLSNVILEESDILLNITGASIARSCVVPNKYLPARVNQHVSIIRPNKLEILPLFLNYLITSKTYKDKLLLIGEKAGSTRQALTKTQIQNFIIQFPSLQEQKEIVSKLDWLEEKVQKLEKIYQQKLKALAELKQSILQKAFTGQLTTPLNKES